MAYLHTYSSRGGWVLGVMIQGATRKVTLSVKTDTSERGWGERRAQWLLGFLGAPHLSLDTFFILNLPVCPPG